jgi:hypothetical protein
MHYGHPDVFDRIFHFTTGGVSKSSPGINLSEDIFAGILSALLSRPHRLFLHFDFFVFCFLFSSYGCVPCFVLFVFSRFSLLLCS